MQIRDRFSVRMRGGVQRACGSGGEPPGNRITRTTTVMAAADPNPEGRGNGGGHARRLALIIMI